MEYYTQCLEIAKKRHTSFSELFLFLFSLKETILKVNLDYNQEKTIFTFSINSKMFCSITKNKIYYYYNYNEKYIKFIHSLSKIVIDAISDFSDDLNLKLIENETISGSNLTAHFLGALAGYKFI